MVNKMIATQKGCENRNSKLSLRKTEESFNSKIWGKNKKLSEKEKMSRERNWSRPVPHKVGENETSGSSPRDDLIKGRKEIGGRINSGSTPATNTDRRNVKSGSLSVPFIAETATAAKSSFVTCNKIGDAKKVKTVAVKKVSCDPKNPKPECKQRVSLLEKHNPRTGINFGKASSLKKSPACPPCEKGKEVEKNSDCSNVNKTRSGQRVTKFCEKVSKTGDGSGVAGRDGTERKIARGNAEKTWKARSRSTEVKRMKSEDNSAFPRSNISQRSYSLRARQAASEIKHLNFEDKSTNGVAQLPGNPFNAELKNILHVHKAESGGKGREGKEAGEKSSHDLENGDQDLALRDLSSLRPIEYYDSFDSLARKPNEEVLSLDKRIWNELEEEIRETCDKTDLLCETGDDSEESFSDIIRHLCLPREEEEAKSEKNPCIRGLEAGNSVKEGEIEAGEIGESRKETETIKIMPEAGKHKPKSLEVGNFESRWEDQQNKVVGARNLEKDSITPSEFFETHKNVGFIGKMEDEECVSFDPTKVTLYQPHETQMLLYDLANCIASQAYLRMCGIKYKLAERKNAEDMSPSGKVPFVSSSLCIIPEFEGIVSFMQYKKYSITRIEDRDKPAFRATVSMIVDVLESAERYICWCEDETMAKYTKPKLAGMFPFPLNHIIYWKKRYEERKSFAEAGIREKSFDTILNEINGCFNTLSELLGNNSFFFGNSFSEIDALVFGHIYAVFSTERIGLFGDLQNILKKFNNLLIFAINFDKMFSLDKLSSFDLHRFG